MFGIEQPKFENDFHSLNCTIKFLNFRMPENFKYCNVPKIQTKSPNLRVLHHKDANGIANSEDSYQIAPLGAI